MIEVWNLIFSYLKCLLDFVLFFWFSSQFFQSKWENRQKTFTIFTLLPLSLLLFGINFLHIPYLNTVMAFISALTINFLLFRASKTARILCSAVEVLLIVSCELIPICIHTIFLQSNLVSVTYETIKNGGFNLISTGLFCVLILIVRYAVLLRKQKREELEVKENFSIIIVPLVSIFMIYYILYINDPGLSPNETAPVFHSIFLSLGILVMNIVAIIGDASTRKQQFFKQEIEKLNRMEQMNQALINQQEQYIDELKGFAHDYVKQMNGFKKLIESECQSPAKEWNFKVYADQMSAVIERNYRFAFIPTPALRGILSQIQIRCTSEKILFEADIQYADFSFITFPDLYTIFENPLTNSLESCLALKNDSEKIIKLVILRKKDIIWVKISNPKTTPVIMKNQRFQTTKNAPGYHGLGIKNMKQAVSRYGGYVQIDYTENEFCVIISLPAPKK